MLTRERLTGDLRSLGVTPGTTLLVHASLRGVGPTAGGRPDQDVLAALLAALGPRGTLVVPAFTSGNSDTSSLHLARVRGMTGEQAAAYRAAMPAFDPDRTPSEGMGRLAEAVRLSPGAVRSHHPQTSFAALGPAARRLLAGHDETCHYGERSPLARLYEEGAGILLLNVGYDVCTAFHLAEYRIPHNPRRSYRCVVLRDGRPQWITYEDANLDDSDFEAIGKAFEAAGSEGSEGFEGSEGSEETEAASGTPGPSGARARFRDGRVGGAPAVLVDLRAAVDHAVTWMTTHRATRRRTPS